MHIHMHVYIRIRIFYVCMYIYMYLYICIYVYIFICIHIYITGKSSIERVVFHKMSPHETLFLESTLNVDIHYIGITFYIFIHTYIHMHTRIHKFMNNNGFKFIIMNENHVNYPFILTTFWSRPHMRPIYSNVF
jgi:hypothetical protein